MGEDPPLDYAVEEVDLDLHFVAPDFRLHSLSAREVFVANDGCKLEGFSSCSVALKFLAALVAILDRKMLYDQAHHNYDKQVVFSSDLS